MANEYWEKQSGDKSYWNKSGGVAAADDTGLQRFMVQTFSWMAAGLAITAICAAVTVSSDVMLQLIFGNSFTFIILLLAEIGLVIGFGAALKRGASFPVLVGMLGVYSALNGVTLSVILMAYTMSSVAGTFFVTSGTFAGMAAFGYVTKRDLTGMGSFMIMGLWGLILTGIVNIFLGSPIIYFAQGLIGVFIFIGLTAYDTQKLKSYYASYAGNESGLASASLAGALSLYLDFINLFLYLLRLFGRRK